TSDLARSGTLADVRQIIQSVKDDFVMSALCTRNREFESISLRQSVLLRLQIRSMRSKNAPVRTYSRGSWQRRTRPSPDLADLRLVLSAAIRGQRFGGRS